MAEKTQGQWTLHGVNRALSGESDALDQLTRSLSQVIQNRVARVLVRTMSGRPNLRSVVEDFTQEIFFYLFDQQGQILRDWDPEQGLSLESFVALVTERRVISILRRARRNPWTEEPTEILKLDSRTTEPAPDERAIGRDRVDRLLQNLRLELSPLGWHVFELLFVRECSVAEVGRATQLSADAIYAWRSRLRRLARRLRDEEAP